MLMTAYEQSILEELRTWQVKMQKRPSIFNKLSKRVQTKINTWIPEKVHKAITATIKQMIRGVLFGAKHTSADILGIQGLAKTIPRSLKLMNQGKRFRSISEALPLHALLHYS